MSGSRASQRSAISSVLATAEGWSWKSSAISSPERTKKPLPSKLEALGSSRFEPVPMQSSASWWPWSWALEVVGVVGGQQRQASRSIDHLQSSAFTLVLGVDAVALDLQVEAVPEDRANSSTRLPGGLHLPPVMARADHRGEAARGRDQALAVLAQQVHVDAGLVVEALEVALGDEVHEVAVPGLVHGQQQQVVDGVEAADSSRSRFSFSKREPAAM